VGGAAILGNLKIFWNGISRAGLLGNFSDSFIFCYPPPRGASPMKTKGFSGLRTGAASGGGTTVSPTLPAKYGVGPGKKNENKLNF
jgi:hypothetical protein